MRELAEIMSEEELFSLPVEIQQAVANQRLEGLELSREVILDSLRQIRGEISIEELIRKYKTRSKN
jgi:Antitoxin VbhA